MTEKTWEKDPEGVWTECTVMGLCDNCFARTDPGSPVLICPDEPGPHPRAWESYCSTECRDARQVVLGFIKTLVGAAEDLRNS